MKDLKIITLSDVVAEKVKFLWKPYIPCGKISIIQGDPGEGKTTLAFSEGWVAGACGAVEYYS